MNNTTFEASGQYLEVDPPRLLVQTWVASWSGDVQTTLRWELEAKGDGTAGSSCRCVACGPPMPSARCR